jgi:hypothetical protein
MTARTQRAAAALVRGWAHLYTSGLAPHMRAARRAEIESDLWESAHDQSAPQGTAAALLICARLILGIPNDLLWRAAQTSPRTRRVMRLGLTATAAAFVLGMLWVYEQLRPHQPPLPPQLMKFVAAPPPPPER